MTTNKEVYHEGWLIKSPPTKRIWRAVSHFCLHFCGVWVINILAALFFRVLYLTLTPTHKVAFEIIEFSMTASRMIIDFSEFSCMNVLFY